MSKKNGNIFVEIIKMESSNLEINEEEIKSIEIEKTPENVFLHFLRKCGIEVTTIGFLDGILIPRDVLLIDSKYDEAMKLMDELRTVMKGKISSSSLTCLHKNATNNQRWPLINLVRQILKVNDYKMVPIRKSNGYDKTGKKKYLRYFRVEKTKKIE